MMRNAVARALAIAAALVVLVVASQGAVLAQGRGQSGLPAGPGNPFASLQQQIDALSARLATLEGGSGSQSTVMWINHLDFLAGDTDVVTSFNATSSGVGGGLSGLIIQSTTAGENSVSGGNKVVELGLEVPPGWLLRGVRVCYELSDARSFISQIRLAQVQDPPAIALVFLDDGMDLIDPGPVCVDSAQLTGSEIDPSVGSVLLSLRVNFDAAGILGAGSDRIVLRGVGLHLFKP
jgi:hypothetical protein